MTKVSKGSRKLLIAQMNKAIAFHPLPEGRQNLINIYTTMLIELGIYGGFNYSDWLNGGFERWVADGKPQDNNAYLGDKTLIKFL